MSNTFVMSARQAAELDHAMERNGLTPSDVKWLSDGENLSLVLELRRGWSKAVPVVVLNKVGEITIPARTTPFVTRDNFVEICREDMLPTSVPVLMLDNLAFVAHFDYVVPPSSAVDVCVGELVRPTLGKDIIKEAGKEKALSMADVFALMSNQINWVDGPIHTNGMRNLFLVRGREDAHLISIMKGRRAAWDIPRWFVSIYPTNFKWTWEKGARFFHKK